jgi:hypothetical protein
MRPRVRPDSGARTTIFPEVPTRVRQSPGTTAPVARSIPAGQTFWVLDGPECADNILWWHIEGYDQSGRWVGWIGEGQSGTYWIEPFETGPIDCPGAPPPRMVPGEDGRITYQPPLPSRVRTQPSINGRIEGELDPGEEFRVISGPVCDTDRNLRWWLVSADQIDGWVAEGTPGEYWIELLP